MEDIESQYIDSHGKTRAIKVGFEEGDVWIFCEPSHPHPVKVEDFSENAYPVVKKFISSLAIDPTYHSLNELLVGVSFVLNGKKYYIPTIATPSSRVESIKATSPLDIRSSKNSSYEEFSFYRRLSVLLRAYTISYYARHQKVDYIVDAAQVDIYDLDDLKREYSETSSVFRTGKLVYPSQKTADSCISEVKVRMLNDSYLFPKIAARKRPYVFKLPIEDYKKYLGQMIFTSSDSFKSYILGSTAEGSSHEISTEFNERTGEPYLYKRPEVFGGKLFLIQNVYQADENGYERAAKVVDIWKKTGVNLGFYAEYYGKGTAKPVFYDYELGTGDYSDSFVCKKENIFMAVLTIKQ